MQLPASQTETVESLLGRMAGASPDAGGGAAAALAGAAAAALVAKVAAVAARHAPAETRLGAMAAEADQARERMAALIALDVDAYARVIEARRRADDGRAAAVRGALMRASEVPLAIARDCVRVLEHALEMVGAARPSMLGDLGVAAALGAGALEGAALIVRVNLEGLDDPALARDAERELSGLIGQGATLRQRVSEAIAGRATPPRQAN